MLTEKELQLLNRTRILSKYPGVYNYRRDLYWEARVLFAWLAFDSWYYEIARSRCATGNKGNIQTCDSFWQTGHEDPWGICILRIVLHCQNGARTRVFYRSVVRDHARNPSKANKVQRLDVEVSANNAQLGMPAILLGIFGFAIKHNRRSILTPMVKWLPISNELSN